MVFTRAPIESTKKVYTVNLEYHDSITLNVAAKSEEEAKEKAIDAWVKNYNYEYDENSITATVEGEEE